MVIVITKSMCVSVLVMVDYWIKTMDRQNERGSTGVAHKTAESKRILRSIASTGAANLRTSVGMGTVKFLARCV